MLFFNYFALNEKDKKKKKRYIVNLIAHLLLYQDLRILFLR